MLYSFSAGPVFIRQNLPSTDVRFWRIKTVPALNGLSDDPEYIRVLHFLLAQYISALKQDKTWHQTAIFQNRCLLFYQIWIIFTHLKLWITSARHKFKWVKIPFFYTHLVINADHTFTSQIFIVRHYPWAGVCIMCGVVRDNGDNKCYTNILWLLGQPILLWCDI